MAAMSATATPKRRALQAAAPLFAGLVLLGACSKKDETTTTATTASTAASSSGGGSTTTAKAADKTTTTTGGTTKGTTTKGSTPGTTAKGGTEAGDKTFWFKGFKVTLGEMKVDDTEGKLTFPATVENLATGRSPMYADFSLEADGAVYGTGGWVDNPEVLEKSKAKDTLSFNIDDKFDADATTLVIGNGNEDQVRIPLDGSKITPLEPQAQEYKGEIKLGQVTYNISKTELRYDRLDNHSQAEKDTAFLVLWGESKNTSATETFYLDPSKFEIALPDDTKSSTEHYEGCLLYTSDAADE